MRSGAIWLAVAIGAVLGGCGGDSGPGRLEDWLAQADAAFAQGESAAAEAGRAEGAGRAAAWARAVAAWRDAAGDYVRAFRLLDPTPEELQPRADLCFVIGRAWSKAARMGSDPAERDVHGERALFWFTHARRLTGGLAALAYEEALLHDSDIAAVRDEQRAVEEYRRYLADGPPELTGPPLGPTEERIQAMQRHARSRIEALTAEPEPAPAPGDR